ncbi:hypothetical protein V3C99_015155 [Haemonchus contortus]|uniref:XK-related protein n=1 Tax=Haemonchus contortus TaxID=6289 RepID=A0A7I4YV85_HAECO
MRSVSHCCRAWLSFVLLQDIGVIWMCYSGQAGLLFKTVSLAAARQYALSVVLICVVRLFLLGYFDSWPLHVCHLSMTAMYLLSMATEIYYYQSMIAAVPNIARMAVQAVTIVGLILAQKWLVSPPPEPPRRKGRLFAKHYMEGDLLKPPETDDVSQLRKKYL